MHRWTGLASRKEPEIRCRWIPLLYTMDTATPSVTFELCQLVHVSVPFAEHGSQSNASSCRLEQPALAFSAFPVDFHGPRIRRYGLPSLMLDTEASVALERSKDGSYSAH